MKTVSTYTSAEIQKKITTPFYVVRLGFNTPLYLSTGDTVTIDGNTYTGTGFELAKAKRGKGGRLTGSIKVHNQDLVMSAIILNEGVKNKSFTLYKVYGSGPFSASDLNLVAEGMMDGVPLIEDKAVITFISGTRFTYYSPRLMFQPPVFNHLIPSGVIIDWNNDSYKLPKAQEVVVRYK